MLIALAVWFLGLFGVAPTDAELQAMEDDSRLRGHHLSVDFGSLRGDVERKPGIGLGYEYIVDNHYHGVSFEVLGTVYGRPSQVDENYWVAGGIGYFPIRLIKIFAQAGPFFEVNSDDVRIAGRVGVGIRFPFFMVEVLPFLAAGAVTSATADDGTRLPTEFMWTLGARLQY